VNVFRVLWVTGVVLMNFNGVCMYTKSEVQKSKAKIHAINDQIGSMEEEWGGVCRGDNPELEQLFLSIHGAKDAVKRCYSDEIKALGKRKHKCLQKLWKLKKYEQHRRGRK
jgi:hypothetical protein